MLTMGLELQLGTRSGGRGLSLLVRCASAGSQGAADPPGVAPASALILVIKLMDGDHLLSIVCELVLSLCVTKFKFGFEIVTILTSVYNNNYYPRTLQGIGVRGPPERVLSEAQIPSRAPMQATLLILRKKSPRNRGDFLNYL